LRDDEVEELVRQNVEARPADQPQELASTPTRAPGGKGARPEPPPSEAPGGGGGPSGK
jgi:hypothetical protein